MKHNILLAAIAAATLLCSCNGSKFKVEGNIAGATDTTTLLLEESSNGQWFLVDTVKIDKKGNFAYSGDAPAVPDIYRLRHGNDFVCFPIDSIDHLTVKTSLNGFGSNYTLSGSDHARQVMEVDKAAMKMENATAQQLTAWKRKLTEDYILKDPSGIVAYYIINKYINGKPVFDPLNDDDMRIIGAVANAFHSFKPDDPRTGYLVQQLLSAQQRRRAAHNELDTIHVTQTSLIDIKLEDKNGKMQSLASVAAHNKVVLLNFTAYSAQFSPAFNKTLNDLYVKYKGQGLQIYQIGLDANAADWQRAAASLPWITVYDPMGDQSANVSTYQVATIPTVFIIKNGEVVKRVADFTQLPAAVSGIL